MADSSKDFAKMKVADLKRELKLRGLSTVGNKQELQERLVTATSDSADSSLLLLEDGPVADAEDILNEDEVLAEDEDDADADDDAELEATPDDGCADSSKRLLEDSDEELDSGVTSSPGAKQGTTSTQGSAKKIILNRKGPVAVPAPSPGKENVAVSKPEGEEPSEKNIIKLSAVSMEKRLELRAAKFGPVTSDTSKKDARAARFGSTSSTPAPAAISTAGSSVSAEVLKKRAERFGLVAGSASEKAELEEKKRKRLERFGDTSTKPATAAATAAVTAPATASATNGAATAAAKVAVTVAATASNKTPITAPTSGDASLDEKKRLRAERFKVTAK